MLKADPPSPVGMVDQGVAVALDGEDRLVAVALVLPHRLGVVPVEQGRQALCSELLSRVAGVAVLYGLLWNLVGREVVEVGGGFLRLQKQVGP